VCVLRMSSLVRMKNNEAHPAAGKDACDLGAPSPLFFFLRKNAPRGLFFFGRELFLVFFSSLNTFFLIAEHPHASVSGAASLSFLIHIIYI